MGQSGWIRGFGHSGLNRPNRLSGPFSVGLLLAALLAPAAGLAQSEAQTAPEGGPRVQEIRAVERGAFIESDFGLTFIVNKLDGKRVGLTSPTLALYGGYDVLPILNVSLGVKALAASGDDDPLIQGPRGDLFFVAPTLRVQFALLTTERDFFWINAEAGFAFGLPKTIDGADFGGFGPIFAGGIGYERFTSLRHFSIGVQAGVLVLTKPAVGIGISLMPTLKYTF